MFHIAYGEPHNICQVNWDLHLFSEMKRNVSLIEFILGVNRKAIGRSYKIFIITVSGRSKIYLEGENQLPYKIVYLLSIQFSDIFNLFCLYIPEYTSGSYITREGK